MSAGVARLESAGASGGSICPKMNEGVARHG
jgi:hypothetical protein